MPNYYINKTSKILFDKDYKTLPWDKSERDFSNWRTAMLFLDENI